MPKIELVPEIVDDFGSILCHLARNCSDESPMRIREIIQAIAVLEHNPLIGRIVDVGKRELVIGHGTNGYIALYRYIQNIDTVFVLAICSQKELGFL